MRIAVPNKLAWRTGGCAQPRWTSDESGYFYKNLDHQVSWYAGPKGQIEIGAIVGMRIDETSDGIGSKREALLACARKFGRMVVFALVPPVRARRISQISKLGADTPGPGLDHFRQTGHHMTLFGPGQKKGEVPLCQT